MIGFLENEKNICQKWFLFRPSKSVAPPRRGHTFSSAKSESFLADIFFVFKKLEIETKCWPRKRFRNFFWIFFCFLNELEDVWNYICACKNRDFDSNFYIFFWKFEKLDFFWGFFFFTFRGERENIDQKKNPQIFFLLHHIW